MIDNFTERKVLPAVVLAGFFVYFVTAAMDYYQI